MTISEPTQLGGLIRRFRLEAGLSQEQLAERSGLSARAVSDLERGLRSSTRPETLRMLADGLALNDEQREALLSAARPDLREPSDGGEPEPAALLVQPTVDLPDLPGPLIGHDRDVAELVSRLVDGDTRLVTLTGPGGVGKTRLALEVAHQAAPAFSGGVVFVDLAPISDPGLVETTIAQSMGVREIGDRPLKNRLRNALSARHLLLFLDNFEQVIEAAPAVSDLLAGTPLPRVLITSREALRVRGEYEFVVHPLELPTEREDGLAQTSAVALFVGTARSVKSGFALTEDNAFAIAEICRRLDGLPLAIQLAATRVRHFPPGMLLERLDQRLPVLTGGPRDLPARQRTLHDTIAWSYDLLSPDEQALFRRLGPFVGGATLPAIEAVVPAAGELDLDLLTGVASLVDKNLVRESDDPDGTPRFTMLETIREFALAALLPSGERAPTLDGHARYFSTFTEQVGGFQPHPFRDIDLERMDAEIDNIRAAYSWYEANGDVAGSAKIAWDLFGYCHRSGLFREANQRCQRTLELGQREPLDDLWRGRILAILGNSVTVLGDPVQGEMIERESLDLLKRSATDRADHFWPLMLLAIALREQNRLAEASKCAEEAHRLARSLVDKAFEAHALYQIGKLAWLQDDPGVATTALTESIALSQEHDVPETALYAVTILAMVHIQQRELIEAARLLREADRLWRRCGFRGTDGSWIDEAAALAAAAGKAETAAQLFGFSDAFAESYGVLFPPYTWKENVVDGLRETLGDSGFEAAYARGRGMTLEPAVAMALDVIEAIEQGTST